MIKQVFVVLALVGLAFSAPQPRKLFREHFEDFMALITDKSGHNIRHLLKHYLKYQEFSTTMQYLQSNNFKEIVYEVESLPEFIAVDDYLENNNIDLHYFIDMINDFIDDVTLKKDSHHSGSDTSLSSFLNDAIASFPKDKLSTLFDEKVANFEEFKAAVTSLVTEEWSEIFTALWENETFQNNVQTLNDNGVDVHLVLHDVLAFFGQK